MNRRAIFITRTYTGCREWASSVSESASETAEAPEPACLGILLAGFTGITAWIIGRYSQFWDGVALKNTTGLLGFALILVMLASGAVLVLTMFVAPFQAILRRKFQPLFAALLVAALGFVTYLIPFPTYTDGVAMTLSRQDERFYRELELRLSKLPKPSSTERTPMVPDSWYDELPGLDAIFPNHKELSGEPRVETKKGYSDVIVGGSLSGVTGIRIYRTNDTPEHLNATEYVGSFKEVYPRVYAYHQYF